MTEYYCETCKKEICPDCFILSNGGHNGHQVIKKNQKLKNDLESLQKLFEEVELDCNNQKNLLKECDEKIKKLSALKEEEISEAKKLIQKLNDYYDVKINEFIFYRLKLAAKETAFNQIKDLYLSIQSAKSLDEKKKGEFNSKVKEYSLISPKEPEIIQGKLINKNAINVILAKKNKFKIENIVLKHRESSDSMILGLCLISKNSFASCLEDKSIKIYNLQTLKCEVILKGHTDNVVHVAMIDERYMASCSKDLTIKIWKMVSEFNFELVQSIRAHDNYIRKVIKLSKKRFASCSDDTKMRIWSSIPPFQLIYQFSLETDMVNSMIETSDGNYIITGSGGNDKVLRIYQSISYKKIKEFQNVWCCYKNNLFEYQKTKIVSGGKDVITIVNLANFSVEKKITIPGYLGFLNCGKEIEENVLLFGAKNSLITVDGETYEKTGVKSEESIGEVTDILILGKTMITSSFGGCFSVWSL